MAYKIMAYMDYETGGGFPTEDMPVEYDGIPYESRIAAWRAFWAGQFGRTIDNKLVGYHVYIQEV